MLRITPYSDELHNIASYFLYKAARDEEELMSNLKLQKLVYYAQGLHLILYGDSLFPDKIKAWEHGPVVPQLYHEYKSHGSRGIPKEESFRVKNIKKSIRAFLDEIYTVFGQFSALRLREITHSDECWKDAFPNGVITQASMRRGLKKYIRSDDKE